MPRKKGSKNLKRAKRQLSHPLKTVEVRGRDDDWTIGLPDWDKPGTGWIQVKGRKVEELTALRECIEEVEDGADARG